MKIMLTNPFILKTSLNTYFKNKPESPGIADISTAKIEISTIYNSAGNWTRKNKNFV